MSSYDMRLGLFPGLLSWISGERFEISCLLLAKIYLFIYFLNKVSQETSLLCILDGRARICLGHNLVTFLLGFGTAVS